MPRDIKEQIELPQLVENGRAVRSGAVGPVQDRHDDPERTDRWFVEMQMRFANEQEARAFLKQLLRELRQRS